MFFFCSTCFINWEMEKGNFTEQDNKLKPKCVETEHLKIKNIFQHWQL